MWFLACIPHPEQDFEDYQGRIKTFQGNTNNPNPNVDSGPQVIIEAGPPPKEAVEGTYYAACLTELANGSTAKIFSFWVSTKFTPNEAADTGGNLEIVLEALALVDGKPPPTISRAGITGQPLPSISGKTDATGSFVAALEPGKTASFAGAANPISGSDVVLTDEGVDPVGLRGKFSENRFCARLTGHVAQPAAATRDLDQNKNFCIFAPTKDGDKRPEYEFPKDYSAANCPL